MKLAHDADPIDFQPALLQVQARPPAPLGRGVLHALLGLLAAALAWAALARLDIVAVAEGKLVPAGYLKIVQPAEQGVIKEIFVREGERVREGQVLMRMDTALIAADGRALAAEYHTKRLALRRIEAQLAGKPLAPGAEDPPAIFTQAQAQHAANVAAYQNALAQERSTLERARHDLAAAHEVRAKLLAVLPHYREQERAFEKLSRDGFAGRLMYTDKQRERIEKEQDLKTQEFTLAAAQATIVQSEKRLAQIKADYERLLQAERAEAAPQAERLRQELAKQRHRRELLELRAPQSGTVKDLATHTPGTVVAPGTILMTIVPQGERLRAEVWVSNDDIGFVRAAQPAKIKLAAFQFQKYGMLEGAVAQVSADATEGAFRALIDLARQHLETDGQRYALAPGMQLVAEIHLGDRSVLEYLLSPVRKAFHEAGRER
ncbi:MAG TPA: HlyD family type I secretion periplasmic adaptor subunit [Burkholderiales bacterium]|nr:HlyD family type I secretion periplasmic adaptor subunit [Burkholderiales bacterium]